MTLLVATVKLVAAVVHNVLLDGCKAMTGTGITVNVAMSLGVVQEPELGVMTTWYLALFKPITAVPTVKVAVLKPV